MTTKFVGPHEQAGRRTENVALWTGTALFALLVLAELAVRLGAVPHPNGEIPRWLFLLVAGFGAGPKVAGRATKGGIWNLLPGRKR